MGVLYGYYSAADDRDAVRAVVDAVVRDDGAALAAGYDQRVVKGIDPVVELLPAEVLITGRAAEDVQTDPRRGALVGMAGDGEVVAVSLSDTFRDALAAFDPRLLDDVAVGWARTSRAPAVSGASRTELDPDALGRFLKDLAALAARACSTGRRLYCWICP
ncbi:hypothetical protein ACFWVC_16085 [Streptomyces sp. NPDC058691]|uniref:hypothetical protein n=1 Tax=Streptomyces sp. NPDC058691 TaxID=3346601 RepID=UPI00364DF12E